VARAALDSIAYQVADLLEAMHGDSGIAIGELRVDGGASVNNLLMQTQADLLQTPVVRAAQAETTALGAAYLAGLALAPSSAPGSGNSHEPRRAHRPPARTA
jgi:glycerol kinase